jgi:hypothetical protein
VALGGDSAWSRYEGAPTYYSFWTDPSLKIANALLMQRHLGPIDRARLQDMDRRVRTRRDQLYAIYLDTYTELVARRVVGNALTSWPRSNLLPEALARACGVEDAQVGASPRSRLDLVAYLRARLDVPDEEEGA